MTNKINYKINIDKIKYKYYNKIEMEIFTYKEHLLYEKFINERLYGLQEEYSIYKRTNQKLHNEHDKIFRKIFITNDLINQESDVIYKMKNRNIFFLIEHQTKIDYSMPYRILEYENEIIKSAIDYSKLKQKGYKYPLVISIVLYTGNRKWNAKKYIKEIQENLEGYEEIQFARYNVVDVNEFDNDELLKDKTFLTKAMLIEKTRNEKELIKYLENIVIEVNMKRNFYSEDIKEIIICLINLILKDRIGEEKAEELTKKIKEGDEKVLAVLEMLERNDKKMFRKGKKEGKKEIIKAMINENIPIDIISKITKFTKKEIENLK